METRRAPASVSLVGGILTGAAGFLLLLALPPGPRWSLNLPLFVAMTVVASTTFAWTRFAVRARPGFSAANAALSLMSFILVFLLMVPAPTSVP